MTSQPLDRFGELPLEAQYAIDRLCTQFEEALRAGEAPVLETYLQQVPAAQQSALCTELLSLEVEYRRRKEGPVAAPGGGAEDPPTIRHPGVTPTVKAAPAEPASLPAVPG